MADKYLRFGTTMLPQRGGSHPIGTTKAESPIAQLSNGGAYRILGSETARGSKFDLKLSGKITTDTDWAYWTTLSELRSLRGKYDQLYRFNELTGESVWSYAECAQIDAIRGAEHRRWIEVALDFNVYGDTWNGGYYTTGGGFLYHSGILYGSGHTYHESLLTPIVLNTNPKSFNLPNKGNAPVRSIIFALTPASTITAFTLAGAGFKWTWTGSLPVGTQLIIDTGGKRVRTLTGGVYSPAYTLALDFTVMTSLDWVTLAAAIPPAIANTTLTVTFTGGGTTSTLGYAYSDGWY